MTERRLYLDVGPGESRGVVTLDGRPERLLIQREGDSPVQMLGARAVGRVRRVELAQGLAFVDLGDGPEAIVNLTPETGRLIEGAAVEVEVRTEARAGKGASVRILGDAQGDPRIVEAPPSLEVRLQRFAPGAEVRTGAVARSMADGAQEEALQTLFPLPGGGALAVERTRALTAVDVDLGARPGTDAKRAARSANFAALGAAARVLRLKGLGGLVVIDLVGRGHDGPALLSAARAAFGPDNPGVAMGPVSRFGAIELTIPRRSRPAIDILCGEDGHPSALTVALGLLRALEREALADGGGRFEALACVEVAEAAGAGCAQLVGRLGARICVRAEAGRPRSSTEVVRL